MRTDCAGFTKVSAINDPFRASSFQQEKPQNGDHCQEEEGVFHSTGDGSERRAADQSLSHSFYYAAQFVADGIFYAELNELLTRELAEDGYSGVEVRVTPMRTEIIIKATRTQSVLGKGTQIHWDGQQKQFMHVHGFLMASCFNSDGCSFHSLWSFWQLFQLRRKVLGSAWRQS
jgi:hypothetical protein